VHAEGLGFQYENKGNHLCKKRGDGNREKTPVFLIVSALGIRVYLQLDRLGRFPLRDHQAVVWILRELQVSDERFSYSMRVEGFY
jgi:hypothetical protein